MEYKLFTDYITLQALLKKAGLIQSGGAVKIFLEETTVLFNGQIEKRRGKKIRVGDVITIPQDNITITIAEPNEAEKIKYEKEQAEKKRVADLVKTLNQKNKRRQKNTHKAANKKATSANSDKPVRFPGM
ncbi:S4 domain-containing protein YaaA [Streptococcus sp. H49]|uniref:S4 domain-containing protein YaaA n=1 Tax=Streptococcus huangxiaojuni TaxID=3237239 RepID=UPI0034A293ED